MEAKPDSGDEYEALKRADMSEGAINPDDNVERYSFAASLFKYEEKRYEALKQLISEDGGVIKPVFAVKTKGKILVIDGWHRVLASKELDIPCPAAFYKGLSDAQMENAALNLNLSGRKMRAKDRREIAIALYEQYKWGYGRISRAIGDKNKTNVQRWITEYKKQQEGGSAASDVEGETEIDKTYRVFERGLKKIRSFFGASRLLGVRVGESDMDKLREIVQSLQKVIEEQEQ
jgi:hypothetical protein